MVIIIELFFFNFTGSNSVYSQTSQRSSSRNSIQMPAPGFLGILCHGKFLFSKKIPMFFEKWKKMITILKRIHEKIFLYFSKVGMETDKTVKEGTKRYMIGDINSRKDCIKTMTYSSCKFLTPVT